MISIHRIVVYNKKRGTIFMKSKEIRPVHLIVISALTVAFNCILQFFISLLACVSSILLQPEINEIFRVALESGVLK